MHTIDSFNEKDFSLLPSFTVRSDKSIYIHMRGQNNIDQPTKVFHIAQNYHSDLKLKVRI